MKVKLISASGSVPIVRNGIRQDIAAIYEYRDIDTGKEYVVGSPQEMLDKGAEIISQNY